MPRFYQTFGECMVGVSGSSFDLSPAAQLGLATESISISIELNKKPIFTDDYGPDCPATYALYPSEATIRMKLTHWNVDVLGLCMDAAKGLGGFPASAPFFGILGTGGFGPAGQLICRGINKTALTYPYAVNPYNWISLYLVKAPRGAVNEPRSVADFYFPTCILEDVVELPIGTKMTEASLTWKAIGFNGPNTSGEVISNNGVVSVQTAIPDNVLSAIYGINVNVFRNLGLTL